MGVRVAESDSPRSPGIPDGTLANTIGVPQNNLSLVEERLLEGGVAATVVAGVVASLRRSVVISDAPLRSRGGHAYRGRAPRTRA